MAKWGEIKCPRCVSLEERLEAAQRDAKEAEAYAEELEAQIAAMEEGLTAVHMAGYMDGQKAAEARKNNACMSCGAPTPNDFCGFCLEEE